MGRDGGVKGGTRVEMGSQGFIRKLLLEADMDVGADNTQEVDKNVSLTREFA